MALTTAEIEALRYHLGYGNINVGGYPYTPDGFFELFTQVVAPNLTTGIETSATTAVVAGLTTAVTPVAMTGIVMYGRLVVDVGDDAEVVVVAAAAGSTFWAKFAKAHAATGYPIATESGVSRLRLLLHAATAAWNKLQASTVTSVAGLQSVGNGEAVWFKGGAVLRDTLEHYRAICRSLSDLVRVPLRTDDGGGQIEAY